MISGFTFKSGTFEYDAWLTDNITQSSIVPVHPPIIDNNGIMYLVYSGLYQENGTYVVTDVITVLAVDTNDKDNDNIPKKKWVKHFDSKTAYTGNTNYKYNSLLNSSIVLDKNQDSLYIVTRDMTAANSMELTALNIGDDILQLGNVTEPRAPNKARFKIPLSKDDKITIEYGYFGSGTNPSATKNESFDLQAFKLYFTDENAEPDSSFFDSDNFNIEIENGDYIGLTDGTLDTTQLNTMGGHKVWVDESYAGQLNLPNPFHLMYQDKKEYSLTSFDYYSYQVKEF